VERGSVLPFFLCYGNAHRRPQRGVPKAAARFTCAQGKARRTPKRGRLSVDG